MKNYHNDETIKRMANSIEQSLARQEAVRSEFRDELVSINENIDTKLQRIKSTVNDIKKITGDMKHDITRCGIRMTITVIIVQIISALLVHFLK